jgi:hypothetical protein
MNDLELNIKLKLAAEQLVSDLTRVTTQFEQSMVGMKDAAESAGGTGESFSKIGTSASEATSGVAGLSVSLGQLGAALSGIAASVGVVALLKSLVESGINYNATLETSKMGITSLIAAQSDLTDSQGKLLTGTEALDAAQALAEGQMQKLKIAGLQTSATFQQLAEAYQVAVGAGLGAGLNLDQIRTLTVQITQAAGALGVPMYQINQEVQSILAGTIDFNSRVAKSLGISNEMMVTWKAQGVLADELNKRLATFSEMGARIADTWVAAKSNMVEVRDTLMGIATEGMFDNLKKSINDAIGQLIDVSKGTIRSDLNALVSNMSTAFSAIGKEIGSWITGFVDGLKDASAWLEKNQGYVNETAESFKLLWDQVKGLVGELLGAAGAVGSVDAQTGTLAKTMQVVAVFVGYVRDGVDALKISFSLFASSTAGLIESLVRGMAVLTFGKARDELLSVADSLHAAAQVNFDNATESIDNFASKGAEAGAELAKLNAEVEKAGKSDGFKAMQDDISAFNEKLASGQYTQQQLLDLAGQLQVKFNAMGRDGAASMAEVELAVKSLDTGVTAVQKSSMAMDAALKDLKVDTGHLSGGVSTFAIESVNEFAKVASAAGATGSTISAAFNNALGQTKFKEDVDALVADLNKANAAGKLTSQEFALAMAGAMAKIQEFSGDVGTEFSKAYSDAAISLHNIENDAKATAGQVQTAFNKLIDEAKTKQEAEALKAEFDLLKNSGKLSAAEIKDEYTRLQDKLRETAGQIDGSLGDAFKRMGAKSAEAMNAAFAQMVDDFNRIKASGIASAEGIDAAYQKIKSSLASSIQAMTTASREALQAAKDHTTAIQAGVDAIKAEASAISASANAQKADAEYAKASDEAMKSGSASARAKADALGVAAQAAHAAADAAQADATASRAAAEAAKAEEAAKIALAAAAANPTEATKQAAAAAQDYANQTARGAEEARQAAAQAQAVAAGMASAASEASAMASSVTDAAVAMDHYASNAAKDAQFFAAVAENENAAWRKTFASVQDYIKQIKDAGRDTAGIEDEVKAIGYGWRGTGRLATEAMQELERNLQETAERIKRNEEATRSWASAMDGLRGAAASLKDELDRALGNDKAIEDRAYEEKKRQLDDQLKAAQDAARVKNDANLANEAEAQYQQAINDLNQLHAIKLKEIEDSAKAKSIADEKNHQDELARIASEKAARDQTADLLQRVSSPGYQNTSSAIAQDVAGSGWTSPIASSGTVNNTLNISTNGTLSEETIRREIAPVLTKMMNGSR